MKEKIIKSKLITKYMEENNVEEDTFCKLCNITKKEFNQVMTDDLELDITVILKVADLIKVKLHKMFYPYPKDFIKKFKDRHNKK